MNEPSKNGGFSRRQFLRGAGGASLALPFLPSLVPGRALGAQNPSTRLNFFAMGTFHGGITGANMYPVAAATQTQALLPGHEIRHGMLARTVSGSRASVSPVLSADANELTDRMISKMNVLRGFDIPFEISHHSGGMLGNYGERQVDLEKWPTIDQIMAWSPKFYDAQDPFKKRSLHTVLEGLSWGYANPATRTGAIQNTGYEGSSLRLFDSMFTGTMPPPVAGPKPRPLIVDKVFANYQQLRGGNRRLSANDRGRLEAHMTRLMELERRLLVNSPVASRSCAEVTRPAGDSGKFGWGGGLKFDLQENTEYYQLYNEVIANAFICGHSRIAVTPVGTVFQSYTGNWHQEVSHQHQTPENQQRVVLAAQQAFEQVFLDLARRLDVDAGNGRTVLDDSLLLWTQEAGPSTHQSDSIPVVTLGGAGGYFNTGRYVDYRNATPRAQFRNSNHALVPDGYAGLIYNRLLATVLQSMRIPKAEWTMPGYTGYGSYGSIRGQFVGADGPLYVPGVVESSDTPLPIITAA